MVKYLTYCETKAEEIISILNYSGKVAAFFFFCDAHWGANSKESPDILGVLLGKTSINKVFSGGGHHYLFICR